MAAIRITRPITLQLPFRLCRIQLSHRMLRNMGAVSRFMLRAVAAGLARPMLARTCGLPDATVLRQLQFLADHGYVQCQNDDSCALTELGARMVEVQGLLSQFDMVVGLDTFTTRRHAVHLAIFLGLQHASSAPQDEHPADEGLIYRCEPRRQHYRWFDEINRLRLLLDRPPIMAGLLQSRYPDAANLAWSEREHWIYALHPLEGSAPVWLSARFASEELRFHDLDEDACTPPVPLPVLAMTQTYTAARGLPWPVTVPSPRTRQVEMLGHGELADLYHPDSLIPPGEEPERAWTLVAGLDPQNTRRPPWEDTPVGAGLSMSTHIRQGYIRASFDHRQISAGLDDCDEARVFSFNGREDLESAA